MTTACWIGVGCIVLFFVLSLMGVKICYSMLASGIVGILLLSGLRGTMAVVSTALFSMVSSFDYAVLPMFILMATIITESGMGTSLYASCRTWLGHLPGGLCIATIIACAVFAAVTAFPWASIMAVGAIALPEMARYKYDKKMSLGAIAAGSELGDLIPPSSMFITYGMMTGTSIGTLLISGIIPGLLMAGLYCIVIFGWCKLKPGAGPRGPQSTMKEKLLAFKDVWALLVVIVFVMGGILIGICTPTEAGAMGAVLAFLIACFQKKMSLKVFKRILLSAGSMVGMIYMVISCAMLMKQMIAQSGLPFAMSEAVLSLHLPNIVLIIVILIVYIILGMFVDCMSMVLLTVGIFLPVVQSCGFSAIWFGVILVRMGDIGGLTPPMGMTAFFLKGLSKDRLADVFKGVVPFLAADFVGLALLVAFPQMCEWLPALLGYSIV
ncbi:TRAP transporter large permease [Oscillibacter sp.]|uniref:TRAP transporter large permease n=1 Tax=Oscillibacter sp. TaxID=1945593 RepID=UPI002D7ECD3A|nr:TRAP transporter large permease [Oscillibacter sp.]